MQILKMVKLSKIFSYIFLFISALIIYGSFMLLWIPDRIESLVAEELKIMVYVSESASAEDINNFKKELESIPGIVLTDFKTSLEASRMLREDEMLSEKTGDIEEDFALPHNFILKTESLNPQKIHSALLRIKNMDNVEFVDYPEKEYENAEKFIEKTAFASQISSIFFFFFSFIMLSASSLFYYYTCSENIKMGEIMDLPFLRIWSKGIKKRFLSAFLCSLAAGSLFYAMDFFLAVNLFCLRAAAFSLLSLVVLSIVTFSLICRFCSLN